jgi:HEPN domain-containing protein/predicted nucleotidyltransferase
MTMAPLPSAARVAPPTAAAQARARRLRAELDRMRAVLAQVSNVRQVIVFGSVATGSVSAWSDLDVMVVQQTEQPFVERAVALARLVRPQVGVQFLVYTPEELREVGSRLFVRVEILEKGKVLPMKPREEARRWLEFAGENVRMAELAVGADIFNQACFHAQQSVEKCLKASLVLQGELVPRTHLIADLVQQLPPAARAALGANETTLLELDQFYIPTRYPDAVPGWLPEGLPQRQHAEKALDVARRCHATATELIA